MNKIEILFHTVIWFLREEECNELEDTWFEDIQNFIIAGYLEGEFSVETNQGISDSLIWRIERN